MAKHKLINAMNAVLHVACNYNLLGPIYIAISPKLFSYCGMKYPAFKNRYYLITGHFKGARRFYNLMHQLSKEDFATNTKESLDESYSPYVYYFELVESSNLDVVVYKCDFPRIYPNEDVVIIDVLYFTFNK